MPSSPGRAWTLASPAVAGVVTALILAAGGGTTVVLASRAAPRRASSPPRRISAGVDLPTVTSPPSPAAPPPSPGPVPRADPAGTVWLCRPGIPDNPCAQRLDATSVSATGAREASAASPAAGTPFDCFYVYPTVSLQAAPNADLAVDAAETEVATRQAALFSQVCDVWAPIYRQRTLASLPAGSFDPAAATQVAYSSLLSAWRDYLANYNRSRPVVFIGHSQGTTMLIALLQDQIDPNPGLRRQMVSALLIGGYPEVAPGSDVGGSFHNLPACRSPQQTGCVIGYNSYYGVPSADSQFGRPGDSTLCTNPAALAGGTGVLDPYFVPTGNAPPGPPVSTPYVHYPGLYTATCRSEAGATWLQVTPVRAPGDPRPLLTNRIGITWGLHADDVSLALGNLIQDVAAEEAAYRS